MGKYLVFDLEVENYTERKRFASPWAERNYIVARGWKKQGDPRASWRYYKSKEEALKEHLVIDDDVTLLVGLNIKFDLIWEMAQSNPSLKAFFKRGGSVWCCQYAEYLIEAQHPDYHMVSMDKVVEKYGGTLKLDLVKQLWDQGVPTSQIQEDLLIDYLVGTEAEGRNGGDIGNTEKIFLGQLQRAIEKKMLRTMQLRMDGLCATTEMEFNGLKIDVAEAKRRALELEIELAAATAELDTYIPALPEGLEFNWSSRFHVSALIFGGTLKYQRRLPYLGEDGQPARKKATEEWPVFDGEPVDRHNGVVLDTTCGLFIHIERKQYQDVYLSGKKKGQPKFKKVEVPGELKIKWQDFHHTLPGYTPPLKDWATSQLDPAGHPYYSTGEEVIEALEKRDMPFCKALTRKVALDKELGTYYIKMDPKKGPVGMLACVNPSDHMIHHSLHHVKTVTSRLSSSDPNLQNISRGDKSQVKKVFVSRFVMGMMMEIDYSQLEVVIQGMLTGDENLCRDLNDKIDFHCKRVAAKFHIAYEEALVRCKDENYPEYPQWKKERTKVKEFSFQRAYGAGAAAIADATGMDVEEVKQLILAEDALYPGIGKWYEIVTDQIEKSAVPFKDPFNFYKTYRRGYWQSPTGCMYTWRTHDAPDFLQRNGIAESFSPPEIKNYPIQGTGGEVVQIVLGKLWRHFVANDNYGGKALLVNTVHDCVWFDHDISVQDELAADAKRIMESVPQIMAQEFGMKVTVPFPVEVEVGPNMLELKHYHAKGNH